MNLVVSGPDGRDVVVQILRADSAAADRFVQSWAAFYFVMQLTGNDEYPMFRWTTILRTFDDPPEKEVFAALRGEQLDGLIALEHSAQWTEIKYVATSPMNFYRKEDWVSGIGSGLVDFAMLRSMEMGNRGVISLYSLQAAESFYRDKVGMSETGAVNLEGLREFIASEAAAKAYLKGIRLEQ